MVEEDDEHANMLQKKQISLQNLCSSQKMCEDLFENCFAKLPDLLLGAYFSIPILDPDD